MRIKKYQKIICLGLALLSIIVLPCYANSFNVSGITVNNTNLNFINENMSELFPDTYISSLGNDVNINSLWIRPDVPTDQPAEEVINRVRIFSSSNYYFAIPTNTYNIKCNGVKLNPIDTVELKAFDNDDKFTLYIYYSSSNTFPAITTFDVDNDFVDNSVWNVIYIVDYTQQAVLNITTYTNFLIQNIGKAFTFMTGSALPWVLLGITVSLITFGIHITKRIL